MSQDNQDRDNWRLHKTTKLFRIGSHFLICLSPSLPPSLQQTGRPAHSVVQSSEGGLWALLGSILYPLLAVWRFLTGFLFSSPGPAPAPSQRPGTAPTSGSSGGEPKR